MVFLFLTCVGFSTHVWKFPNRLFFSSLFWRCFWRLIFGVHIWNDRYRHNVIYKILKTKIQVQIQKVAPPIWKNTHMLGFLQTCVAFSTHLCIWYVFDKSHTCVVFATSWKYKLTVVFPKHVWLYPTTSRTSCWVVNSKHVCFFQTCVIFSKHVCFFI